MRAATIAAMRFSKPSSRAFENGRLFGSAQTRSTSGAATGPSAAGGCHAGAGPPGPPEGDGPSDAGAPATLAACDPAVDAGSPGTTAAPAHAHAAATAAATPRRRPGSRTLEAEDMDDIPRAGDPLQVAHRA